MALSFCQNFGEAADGNILSLIGGAAVALKIAATAPDLDTFSPSDPGKGEVDASALKDTGGGSFESTAGDGGGGDGGEPGDGA